MASKGSFRERVWEPLKEIKRTPVARLILLLTLYVLSAFSLLASFTPSLLTNYFASIHSNGASIDCIGDARKDIPETCRLATNAVLAWKSGAAIVTNFILGVFLFPSLGRWSDLWGRKPFIVLGFMGGILQPLSVILYLQHGVPLWWYFIAGVLLQSVNPFLTSLAYVADVIRPSARTVAFATFGIVFSIGFTIGPILTVSGAISNPETAAWASFGCAIVSVLGSIFILPESLSTETKMAARAALEASDVGEKNGCVSWLKTSFRMFWSSLSILFRTTFFTKLTIGILALYLNFEEVLEMQVQYFQEVAGFDKQDTASLFAVAGMSSWFTITVVLWMLLSVFRMSEKQVLLFGMIVFALQQLLYAFVRSKTVILAITAVGTTANLVQPAISSLKSNNVGPEEQGALQGAILSAQSVAKGFGPLVFYLFFVVFRSNKCYLPGAPFLFGFVLLVVAIVVIFTLDVPKSSWGTEKTSTDAEKRDGETAPLIVSHPIAPSDSDDSVYF